MHPRRPILVLLALAVLGAAVGAVAQVVSPLLSAAREQLADRDFAAAARSLSELSDAERGKPAGMEASILLVKAQLAAGDARGAADSARRLIERYPDSAYASKARFLLGDAQAALGDRQAAAAAWRERAEFLSGEQYRLRLAKLYLDIADEGFDGIRSGREGDPLDPPRVTKDLPRAIRFYAKAREVGLPEALWPRVTHRIAQAYLETGNAAGAAVEWAALLERRPDAAEAPEATFGLARAYLAIGRAREGREMLDRVESRFADHALAPLAVEELGSSFAGGDKESVKKRLAHWRRFLGRYPQHERAPVVANRIATALRESGDLDSAVKAYEEVVARWPKHDLGAEAAFGIGAALSERGDRDAARGAWLRFLSQYPNHPRFVEAQRAVVQALYLKGDDRFKAREFETAEKGFREFLAQYPVDALSSVAQLLVGETLRERGDWRKAIDEYAICASKYRASAEAPAAQFKVAELREREEGNLPEAIRQYEALVRTFPHSPQARQAREIVRAMREKHLKVTAARAFASNEPFLLDVESRNIPKLRMKAYKLDLLEYFRKKHRVGGVEELAVEIVAPDKQWQDEVEAWEPYRLYGRQVKLPLEEKGAYVLAVEEDELRAVSLAIRSDISIVVKQGPQSLLVFAKDDVAEVPAAGVRVLVSNGGAIVAEGETGKDGVFGHAFPGSMGEVRVFAHRGKDIAASDVTPAAATTWGYSTKAYIYTDRPVYRPGQKVYWRGIVRRVEGGLYQASANLPVQVAVRDARGIGLVSREVRTNAFGSFSGEVTLGDEPPLGQYVVVASVDGLQFQGKFEVESYKKPEVLVDVEPGRRDFLTGEEVTATARVRYYFGGAVKNAPVKWQVYVRPYAFDAERYQRLAWFFAGTEKGKDRRGDAGARFLLQGEGQADAEGRVPIAFETDPGEDDRLYTIEVEALDPSRRWVSGGANVFVTAKAFYAVLQLDKKVYRPGEAMRATAVAVDASHRGVATRGELVLYRRLASGGEDPVSRIPLTTGEDGRAAVEVKAPRPGDYRLVLVAEDRRSGHVEGGAPLVVAGEAEDLAKEAKILAEREVYNRGDTAQVLVNSPGAPAWALVTFEGEKVLDYRVIRLSSRSTTIPVEMTDAYSPNVFMRVAIPHGKKLYEAEDEVAVLKFLKLTVKPERPEAKPGEKLRWTVEAVDHAGRPVEAEVSLAVVDASIYSIRRDDTPEIQPFFYDQKRERAVATRSSYEWRYDGVTARQAAELLEELARRQAEAESATARKDLGERMYHERRALEAVRDKAGWAGEPAPAETAAAPAAPPPGAMEESLADEKMKEEAGADDADGAGPGGGAGGRFGAKKARAAGKPLMKAPARVRRTFADTAFWTPHVVTGADGKAVVEMTLPDNLTTWRATTRGATRDTLVGSAEADAVATQKVLVRLETPRFATQGDTLEVSTLAYNYSGAPLDIAPPKLAVEGPLALASPQAPVPGSLRVAQGDFAGLRHGAKATGHGTALLKAEALSEVESDVVEHVLAIEPWGVPERVATSGSLDSGEAIFRFEVPADAVEGTERLTLHLTPSVSLAALDAIAYLQDYPWGCLEQTVNRFLPAVAARRAFQRLGMVDEAARQALEESVRRGVTALANGQNRDGGWGWWPQQPSQAVMTALAVLGLELARESGSYVDPDVLEPGRRAAEALLRAVGEDHAARAALLRSLAISRRAPEDEIGRALRAVDELPARAAADLALACADQGRPDLAGRALARVRAHAEALWREAERFRHPFYGGLDEAAAASALALARLDPQSAFLERAIDFLLARRGGQHWRSTRETGVVVMALAAYLEARGVAANDFTVTVLLDGRKFAATEVRRGLADEQKRTLVIRRPDLVPGKHEIRIGLDGAGKCRYTAVAEFVRAVEKIPAAGNLVSVARKVVRWVAPQPERDPKGRPIAPGWSILEPSARPGWQDEEPLSEVASGERVTVRVVVTLREPIHYAIVEDRLPAGLEALSEGQSGPFERYEPRDEKVAFFASHLAAGTHVFSYVARAVTPGEFGVLPAQCSPMYEPEVFGRSEGSRLAVREKPLAPREPTPDELFAQALDLAERGDLERARPIVERLLAMKVLPDVRERLLSILLDAHLARGDAAAAVKTFEELKDRHPRLAAQRAQQRRVGLALAGAYQAIGEHDQAAALYRALVEQQFRLDAEVADVYDSLGRAIGAQDYLADLVRRYPDLPYAIDGWYRVARRYYDLDRPGGKPGRPARKMHEEAYHALKGFIAHHPKSPHCPEAQHFAAQAMFYLEQLDVAALEWEALPRRYPQSEYADDGLFNAMLARFTEKKWDAALALGQRVLAHRSRRSDGRLEESPFVPQAQHVFAKIHHLRGELDRAVEFYRLVAGRFEDARDTLEMLTGTGVEVPEIVGLLPGRAELPVRFKNLDALKVKLYPVDLLLLFARQKDLAAVSRVDLAGIVPRHELEAKLDGRRYDWNDARVALPVTEKGAYLAVAKAGDHDASALLILSEIDVEVQRLPDRVRAYAVTRKDRKPAADCFVTVSEGGRISARGRTDARGVFEARLRSGGAVSAIAERDGHYALWREGE